MARLHFRAWLASYIAAADEVEGDDRISPATIEFWSTTAFVLREVLHKLDVLEGYNPEAKVEQIVGTVEERKGGRGQYGDPLPHDCPAGPGYNPGPTCLKPDPPPAPPPPG